MENFNALFEFLFVIIIALSCVFLSLRFKVPTILGYLFAGIILAVLLPDQINFTSLNGVAQVGATILIFILGFEFSINSLRRSAIFGVLLQSIATIIFSTLILPFLGIQDYEALFIGVVASTGSIIFISKMLELNGESKSSIASIMSEWVGIQGLLLVLWYLVLQTFSPSSIPIPDILSALVNGVIVLCVAYLMNKYVLPPLFEFIAKLDDGEELMLISFIGVLVLYLAFAGAFGIPTFVSAFIAGVILSDSAEKYRILNSLEQIKSLSIVIFFLCLGGLLNFDIVFNNIGSLLVILTLVLLVKVLITILANLWFSTSIRSSIKVSFGTVQMGEFAFLLTQAGFIQGWISQDMYMVMVASILASIFLTPILYINTDWAYRAIEKQVRNRSPQTYRKLFMNRTDID